MAKMTTKQRNALPKSSFAGPGRTYPVNDQAHAVAAKSRATQQYDKGDISKSTKDRITDRANRKIGQ